MLEAKNLSKSFGAVNALTDLNLGVTWSIMPANVPNGRDNAPAARCCRAVPDDAALAGGEAGLFV